MKKDKNVEIEKAESFFKSGFGIYRKGNYRGLNTSSLFTQEKNSFSQDQVIITKSLVKSK